MNLDAKSGARFTGAVADADIRLLRVFRTVVEAGGFTAAEPHLGLARSTISTHIAHLEARLGLRLCSRGRGGFDLTPAGRLVYDEALRALAALDGFAARVSAAHARLVGELHLATIDNVLTLPAIPLVAAVARLRDRAPDVHVSMRTMGTETMERGLLEGTLHAAFMAPGERVRAGLAYRPVAEEVEHLYVGQGHPLFDRPDGAVALADLDRMAHVGRPWVDTARGRVRTDVPDPGATADTLESILILVLSGRFVGPLASQYAAPWVAAGRIRPVMPERIRRVNRFTLATRVSDRDDPLLTAFLHAYAEAAGSHGPADLPPPPVSATNTGSRV